MSKLEEIVRIKDKDKVKKAFFDYIGETFKNIVMAIESKHGLDTALTDFRNIKVAIEALGENNHNIYKGTYMYLLSGIKMLEEAIKAAKDANSKDILELTSSALNGKWKDIYKRAFHKKYDGPLCFDNENINNSLDEMKKDLEDIDGYVKRVMDICFNQMTQEIPDYFEMYQISEDINMKGYFEAIAEIKNACDDVSDKDYELVNDYFSCTIGNKTFNINLGSPIVISCSDGRKIAIKMSFRDESRSYDEIHSYDVCISELSLVFSTKDNFFVECSASVEGNYHYVKDATEFIEDISKPITPKGNGIEWRYIVYKENDYFTEEELKFVCEKFKAFVEGINNPDINRRIAAYMKAIGAKKDVNPKK